MDWVSLFFSPRGRVGRRTFWIIMTSSVLLDLALRGGISAAARWSGNEVVVALFFWAWMVFSVASYFPLIAISIKRLHDTGRSGYWMALPIGATASGLLIVRALFRQDWAQLLAAGLLCAGLSLASLILLYFWGQAGDDGRNDYGVA